MSAQFALVDMDEAKGELGEISIIEMKYLCIDSILSLSRE
jgi:hypothetical protein